MTTSLERQLGTDAAEIIKLHRKITELADGLLDNAIRCGGFLWRVKEELSHGEWTPWCQKNLPSISMDTIQRYIKCYQNKDELKGAEIGDLSKAYKLLKKAKNTPVEKPHSAVFDSGNPKKEVNPPGESPGKNDAKDKPKSSVQQQVPAPEILDRTGFVIPTDSPAMTHWRRTAEANELLSALSRIKCRMEAAQDNRDKMYGEVNFSSIIADLQSAYQLLKVAVPYAVCPTCQGRVLSPCSTCKGRGLISEFYWKHKVPDKTKEIREKAIAALAAKKKDKK